MKSMFAGRSPRRRMRYGYHCGPNGVATSTLKPARDERELERGAHAVEHLELEAVARDAHALGERDHLLDQPLVVRRHRGVRAAGEHGLDESEVGRVDVGLLG